MNLRAGHSRGSSVVQIGDDGLVCEDVAYVACIVSASGEATNGIIAKNAERVSVLACTDLIGDLLMSGRSPYCDSGEPDLWSNGSVFMGPSELISIDPSPHISHSNKPPISRLYDALLISA
jgi:hypothetical protein